MIDVGDPGQQGFFGKNEELEIDKLFRAVVERQGSDLHLKVGLPPFVRAGGALRPMRREPVNDEEMARLVFPMINMQEERKGIFEEHGAIDFVYTIGINGKQWRLRVKVLRQQGHVGLVARCVRGN